jgi:hypothetical protein
VLARLASRLPGLRAVMASGPALLRHLSVLPEESGLARLMLAQPVAAPPGPEAGVRRVVPGIDAAGLAAQVPPVREPLLETGTPVLALDGIGAPPPLLARALAMDPPVAMAAGLRLAVMVDAPPLEPLARLRQRLGLPAEILPLRPWPSPMPRWMRCCRPPLPAEPPRGGRTAR